MSNFAHSRLRASTHCNTLSDDWACLVDSTNWLLHTDHVPGDGAFADSDPSFGRKMPEPDTFALTAGPLMSWEEFATAISQTLLQGARRMGWSFKTSYAIAQSAWTAYQQAYKSQDILVIGASTDIRSILENPSAWAGYQVLSRNPWSWEVNDAWIQGGLDRRATFRLISACDDHPKQEVFHREVRQIKQAGYRQIENLLVPRLG